MGDVHDEKLAKLIGYNIAKQLNKKGKTQKVPSRRGLDRNANKPQKKTPPYKDGVSVKFQQSPVMTENRMVSRFRLSWIELD